MALVAAKCTNCGANLQVDSDKDAAVCPYCGTPFIVEKAINNYHITNNIKADVVNVYGTTSNEYDQRAEALNRMSRMISHFGEKQAEYDELERVTGEIVRRSQGVKKTPLVFGILLTVVGFVCMLFGQNRSQIPTFAIVLLIPGLLLIGLYVLLAILNRNRLEALSVRRNELLEILDRHYAAFPDCPIGLEYTHPGDLYELYELLRKGKASSIKEALNMLFRERDG